MAEGQIISKALGALLDIMTSTDIDEARCIDAARAIIEYEAPMEVFDLTYDYLMGVAEDNGQKVGIKLEALKLLRKVEAKRVVPGTAKAVDTVAAQILGKRVASAKRRREFASAGQWPLPKDWDEGLGEAPGIAVEVEGIAERFVAARERLQGKPTN